MFAADLTHTPIRRDRRIWDGIVCDPPYGVREGLRVLGIRDPEKTPWLVKRGYKTPCTYKSHAPIAPRTPAKYPGAGSLTCFRSPDFIPPKKPYSFLAMLDDILVFAAETLVDNGRLSFWMPTANDRSRKSPCPLTHASSWW